MKLTSESIAEQFAAFDPATLYEAAGHRGMVDPAIRPAWSGARICGIASTVSCPPADNLMMHHAVAAASPGTVIVATVGGYLGTGAWGEILTVAAQAKGVAGLVMDGAVRDIAALPSGASRSSAEASPSVRAPKSASAL
jgi:4-hydroxy-4-methyl-2-oxoglutarate aldolase